MKNRTDHILQEYVLDMEVFVEDGWKIMYDYQHTKQMVLFLKIIQLYVHC